MHELRRKDQRRKHQRHIRSLSFVGRPVHPISTELLIFAAGTNYVQLHCRKEIVVSGSTITRTAATCSLTIFPRAACYACPRGAVSTAWKQCVSGRW